MLSLPRSDWHFCPRGFSLFVLLVGIDQCTGHAVRIPPQRQLDFMLECDAIHEGFWRLALQHLADDGVESVGSAGYLMPYIVHPRRLPPASGMFRH